MTQKEKIQGLLSDGLWHSFSELNEICFRYGARLFELKKDGYEFEKKLVKDVFYYREAPKAEDLYICKGCEKRKVPVKNWQGETKWFCPNCNQKKKESQDQSITML